MWYVNSEIIFKSQYLKIYSISIMYMACHISQLKFFVDSWSDSIFMETREHSIERKSEQSKITKMT